MPDAIPPLTSALSDRYRIERELGEGGMANVYLAEDVKHARQVAVKVLKPELAASVGADRFLREIRTTANLRHPHIVPLYDSGEAAGFLFYVMPFIEGESLEELMEREGQLPLERAIGIVGEVVGALAYAHARGVVHRDIKPGNIMLEGGHAVVTDFGVASAVQVASGTKLTQTGMTVGTPLYMSPDQAMGAGEVDARSDQYSLACVLYEMLAGQPPFTGPTAMGVVMRHMSEPVPALGETRSGIPSHVTGAIERALAKIPDERFESVETWRDALLHLGQVAETPGAPPNSSVATATATAAAQRTDAAPGAVATPGADDELWLAVLPIQSPPDDPGMESFSEGLVEGMVTAFARFSYLHLIGLSSTRQYAGGTVDVRVAGKELGARYVLQGSLRKAGDDVRLSMQLVDVESGTNLWAEAYDRNLRETSLFALQDELAEKVVATVADMHGVLLRSMIEATRTKPVESLTPNEAILRAYAYWLTMYEEEHAEARAALERAVETDPHNADAWACLAIIYIEEYKQNHNLLPKALERSVAAARRAIDLDSSNSVAFDALAQASFFGNDMSAFRIAAERAIALNPLAGYTVAFIGQLIAMAGDWERGLAYNRRAQSLNPRHAGWYHFAPFWDHFRKGEYEQALDEMQQVNMPGYHWTHVSLAAVNGLLGREKAAEKALQEALAMVPNVADEIADGLKLWHLWEEVGPSFIEGLKKAGLDFTGVEGIDAVEPDGTIATADPAAAEESSESIAVLPFTDMSAARDQDYFCEGMAEEILNALSGVGGLRVAARTSTFRLKNEDADIARIGSTLNVSKVLEGSVRTAGDKLRVTAKLINVADGYQLWSERFDRQMEDVFEIQDEIAGHVAEALALRLVETARAPGAPGALGAPGAPGATGATGAPDRAAQPTDIETYQLYLKGRYYRYSKNDMQGARPYFEQAVARDPSHVLSRVGLADIETISAWYSLVRPSEAYSRARGHLDAALALKPDSGEALFAYAVIRLLQDRDSGRSMDDLRRSIELSPEHVHGYAWHGCLLSMLGRQDEAIAVLGKAQSADPLSPFVHGMTGMALLNGGQIAEARRTLDWALELDPENMLALWVSGVTAITEDRHDAGIETLRNVVERSKRAFAHLGLLGWALAVAGRTDEAREILEEWEARSQHEYATAVPVAWLMAELGETERAWDMLWQADEERVGFTLLTGLPGYAPFRDDPRWAEWEARLESDAGR